MVKIDRRPIFADRAHFTIASESLSAILDEIFKRLYAKTEDIDPQMYIAQLLEDTEDVPYHEMISYLMIVYLKTCVDTKAIMDRMAAENSIMKTAIEILMEDD